MATRFSDDIISNTEGSDFIIRHRIPLRIQIFLMFAVAFILIAIASAYISSPDGRAVYYTTLLIGIGSLGWFTILFASQQRDLVLATEFQNAILASAAQLSTRFCLITKRDGSLVYFDPSFQRIFAPYMQGGNRTIDVLLENAGVAGDVARGIISKLEQNKNDRVLFRLQDADNEVLPIMLSIEALPRPKGYFLMRGRDYIEKRNVDTDNEQPLPGSLLHALGALPDGLLVTDASGTITYANSILEEWLDYRAGEIVAQKLSKHNILYQYASHNPGVMVNETYAGDIALQRRDQSIIALQIRQAALDNQGSISAILTLPDGLKKK